MKEDYNGTKVKLSLKMQ